MCSKGNMSFILPRKWCLTVKSIGPQWKKREGSQHTMDVQTIIGLCKKAAEDYQTKNVYLLAK